MTRHLTATLIVACLFAMAAHAVPSISADSTYHATSIQTESLVIHTFTLTNEGDDVLVISDVVPSCSCTTFTLDRWELAPGETAEMVVTVDTHGFAGLVTREIYVFSNDLNSPALLFTIDVDSPVRASPAKLAQADFLSAFYVLIDVRTQEEHDAGHLLGSILIPLSELQGNLDAWTPYLPKDVPLVLYCKGGFRSAIAAQILYDAGFENVIDLLGGMDQWVETYGEGYLFDRTPLFDAES